jgi:hypothetical protein
MQQPAVCGAEVQCLWEEGEMTRDDIMHTCSPLCERPICMAVRKAVEAEREQCALLCERIKLKGREVFADAIRARGKS